MSLVELLVVLSVLTVLAAILIPVTGKVRASSRAAGCASNLRQLGTLLILYAQDKGGRLPGENSPHWDHATLSMLPASGGEAPYNPLLRCPADDVARPDPYAAVPRSYGYNPVLCNPGGAYGNASMYGANLPAANQGMRLNGIVNPARMILLIEFHDSRNSYDRGDYATRTALFAAHGESMNAVFADGRVQRFAITSELQAAGAYGLTQFVNLYMRNSP